MQAHAKGALAVRPQQHVTMRGLCTAMLTRLSATALRAVSSRAASNVRALGWGSIVKNADGYAASEAWENYCGERSVCWPLE